jgi:hypothetical protein
MMVVAVDLRHPYQPSSIEIAELWARLQQLVGQPFLFFRLSYGEELTAHLGTPKEATSPKLRSRVRGSYVLTFRGSLWSLSSGPEQTILLADPFSVPAGTHTRQVESDELEKSPIISRNAPVITTSPFIDRDSGGIGLLLSFADQSTLAGRQHFCG